MPHQCTGCGQTFEDGSKEMLSGCPECGGNTFQFRPSGATFEEVDESSGDGPPTGDPPDPPERPDSTSSSVAETVGRATTRVRDFVASSPTPSGDGDAGPDPHASWPSESGEDPETEGGPEPTNPSVSGGDSDGEIIDADARRAHRDDRDEEDVAQASARSDVVDATELDASTTWGDEESPSSDDTGTGSSDDTGTAESEGTWTERTDDTGTDTSTETPADPTATEGRVVSEPSGDDPDLADLREQLNDQFESIKIVEPGQYELNLMELYDREEYIIALQENGRYVIQVPEQWIGDEPGER